MSGPVWRDRSPEWLAGYRTGYRATERPSQGQAIRWRDGGPEMRCNDCTTKGTEARRASESTYWPLTEEFWNPRNLAACRACLLARKRAAAKAAYWRDPETHRARAAEYARLHRVVVLMKKRARYAENPEEARARNNEWREANRAAIRAYRRAYYARNRVHILQREKLRRAGVLPVAA